MEKELCSEPVSLFFTPTILRQADEIALARGLSRAALLRTLVAQEYKAFATPAVQPQPASDPQIAAA